MRGWGLVDGGWTAGVGARPSSPPLPPLPLPRCELREGRCGGGVAWRGAVWRWGSAISDTAQRTVRRGGGGLSSCRGVRLI